MGERPASQVRARIEVVEGGRATARTDRLAAEEPLEIRLRFAGATKTVAVTMRTPGNDFELAAGFLYSEGVISTAEQVSSVSYCIDPQVDEEQRFNIVNVDLTRAPGDLRNLERHFYTSSACGVCGKANLEALSLRGYEPVGPGVRMTAEVLGSLPDGLRRQQRLFDSTGGLHAAALFDENGVPECLREDVGRHNAVDKLVGWALLHHRMPLDDRALMVSGRASFEIMQKALAAHIPIVCAVSAPSSLAVDLAKRFGMTLVGFLREERFNIYAGSQRIDVRAPVVG